MARGAPSGAAGGAVLATGIGLRTPHAGDILSGRPAVGFLEVHAENYMGGGPPLDMLLHLRRDYPLSLHGVGLSLGSADGVDGGHLARLNDLVSATEPFLVSEHLSWSVVDGTYLNDLLPLPYTAEALETVAANVGAVQDRLRRRILVENPSRYLAFRESPIPEPEFLAALASRTGCGLLCDVNNVFVSTVNLGGDPIAYLDALPSRSVGEIHLAGHFRSEREGRPLLIDDHGSAVDPKVWALYAAARERFGDCPTLIEWDRNLPQLDVLLAEAATADRIAARAAAGHVLAS